jgi:AcrR family transcriptional regulator
MSTRATGNTRERILENALALFTERGLDGTTLQQIADRLGVTKAALYYHFRSKDDLVAALIEPAFEDLDTLLTGHSDDLDTPSQRRQALEGYLDYLLRFRRLMSWLSRDLAALANPAMASRGANYPERIARILGGPELDFAASIRIAVVLGGIQTTIATHPEADPAELREALLATVGPMLGLRRRETRSGIA